MFPCSSIHIRDSASMVNSNRPPGLNGKSGNETTSTAYDSQLLQILLGHERTSMLQRMYISMVQL